MTPIDGGGRLCPQRLSRRDFVRAAAAGGALVGLGGRSLAQEPTSLRLDGGADGWIGRNPPALEGETNPTLTLERDREYELTWTNVDGAAHDFAIEDDDGDEVVGPTSSVDEEGDGQTVEFTATDGMVEYYCTNHPESMRGTIEIVEDGSEATAVEFPDARLVSSRDFNVETYELLHAERKRRALETLLSDPEVRDVVEDMIASYEAYDPYTDRLDAVSVQGTPNVEIDGDIDEGAFAVTAADTQIAYGLVDRGTNELVALTVTEPRDVSWRAWAADDDLEAAQLQRVLADPRVEEYVDGDDWFPLFTIADEITSARGIEHGGVNPIVLFVEDSGSMAAVVAYLDVREDEVGEVVDASRVERFVELPAHELAAEITPEDDSVLETVPGVPFELRPWYTASDGVHRIDVPDASFDGAEWNVEWEPPGLHGVEIAASYRDTTAFATLESPVTFTGYGLPERDGRNTLEWYFPDDEPVFGGEALLWDVHSTEFGGVGPLGVIDFPEDADRPAGFRFRSHYQTGAQTSDAGDHQSGVRFGQSSHELSYDFWEDGTVRPVWRGQGPGFVTEYSARGPDGGDAEADSDDETDADDAIASDNGDVRHEIATFAMDPTPGTTDGVEIAYDDGTGWTMPETEFYRRGEPGTTVRLSNPDGSEAIDVPLDRGIEVVVVRRSAGEIPGRQRLVNPETESAFFHPAQYIGGESIQGERVVVWLLLEAATGAIHRPTGVTSSVAQTQIRLSGY